MCITCNLIVCTQYCLSNHRRLFLLLVCFSHYFYLATLPSLLLLPHVPSVNIISFSRHREERTAKEIPRKEGNTLERGSLFPSPFAHCLYLSSSPVTKIFFPLLPIKFPKGRAGGNPSPVRPFFLPLFRNKDFSRFDEEIKWTKGERKEGRESKHINTTT